MAEHERLARWLDKVADLAELEREAGAPMHPGPLRATLECMRQASVLLTEEGDTHD